MRDFALAFAAIYEFAFGSSLSCLGKPQQSYSWLRAVQFCTRLTGSHAASWGCGILRYTSVSLATALIHTVHGGAEPRACLTGLRV